MTRKAVKVHASKTQGVRFPVELLVALRVQVAKNKADPKRQDKPQTMNEFIVTVVRNAVSGGGRAKKADFVEQPPDGTG